VVAQARWGPWLVSALALTAVTGSAALVAARLYLGWRMPLALVGAAGGAVVLTLLLRWLGSPLVAVAGSLAGLGTALVGLTAALRDPSRGTLPAVAADAIANSGARLMTATVPIDPAPDTVALPTALTWLVGTAAALLLTRWPLAALLPPLGLLGGAVVFVGPNATPAYPLIGLFAVAVAAHLAVTRDGGASAAALTPLTPSARRAEQARRAGVGLAVLAAVGVLAVTVGPGAAGLYQRQPPDPRTLFVPPRQHYDALNPLGMLSKWATDRDIPLLEVQVNRPVRTSWVALTRFDGITWLPSDEFRAAGSVLPTVDPQPRRTTRVTQRVTVRELTGAWLPAAEVPRSVRGLRAGFDARSRMLEAPDGLRGGQEYTVTSQVPLRDPGYLAGAGLPFGPEFRDVSYVPPQLPEKLTELAQRAAGQGTAYQRALRLEKFLRTSYTFSSGAPSGHGYANLRFFLLEPRAKGGGRGTSEQFATAFGLLGRLVGLPTRVVVGFHAGRHSGKGHYLVRSGDAFAWAEVFLLGEGWVPFDPTPAPKGAEPPPEQNTPEAEAESQQKEQQLQQPERPPPPDDPVAAPEPVRGVSGPVVAGLWTVAGVLLVVVFAVPVLRLRRTRARLSRGGPARRVIGAWLEVRDSLRLAGHRIPASQAVAEVAVARGGGDLPDLRQLATWVNAVGFGPAVHPGPNDAAETVDVARRFVASLRRRQHLLRRASWWLDPRPLFWRS